MKRHQRHVPRSGILLVLLEKANRSKENGRATVVDAGLVPDGTFFLCLRRWEKGTAENEGVLQ